MEQKSSAQPPQQPPQQQQLPLQPQQPHPSHSKASRSSVDQYLQRIREAMEARTYDGLAVDVDPSIEELSIFDEPGIDLSVPAPGSGDTFSNAAPHEVAPNQVVFYSTPEGEKAAVVIAVATSDYLLTDPDPDEYPPPEKGVGRGLYGGGGFFLDEEQRKLPPVRVRAKLTDPTVIVRRLDNGKQLGKKIVDLGTVRRSTSTTSVGSAGMTLRVLQERQEQLDEAEQPMDSQQGQEGRQQPGPSLSPVPFASSSP